MSKTRNEIRERNGKIVFWALLFFPFLLFGICFIFMISDLGTVEKSTIKQNKENNFTEIQENQIDSILIK